MSYYGLQADTSAYTQINTIFSFRKVQDCHVLRYISKEESGGKTSQLLVGGKNASPFYVSEPLWVFLLETAVSVVITVQK